MSSRPTLPLLHFSKVSELGRWRDVISQVQLIMPQVRARVPDFERGRSHSYYVYSGEKHISVSVATQMN